MKDEILENNVTSLHSRGWSIRRLSLEFGVSRQRVKRILERNALNRSEGQDLLIPPVKRTSKLDPYKEYIGELLETYIKPPITNRRIFELLEDKGYTGKITILGDYLSKVRGKRKQEPLICVETLPGQLSSHDWSDYYVDFNGGLEREKVIFFSYILNYSRRQYIELVEDKLQTTLFCCLINAFIYFDGLTKKIKGDNQKACVDRWELGKPVFNKNYLNFATHYCFRPLTIKPGKPHENLKVERPFYYFETNFLNGRKFTSKQDLKEQLSNWLLERNDQRIHRTTRRKPIDMYQEELSFLQPLPSKHYDTSIIEYRIVNNESSIQWEGYYYIVPSRYMYESCPVRVNEGKIIIYNPDCIEIACYPLAEKGRKNRYIGRKEKSEKQILSSKDVSERLEAFGQVMQEYILLLKQNKRSSYMHHFRHILSLKVNYHVEDIIAAVRRALRYRVFNAHALENFLKTNFQQRSQIFFPPKTTSHE